MAREITVTKVVDTGNDVLVVSGIVDGKETQASGWASAITNHYDADAYGEDGHRKDDAKPRVMNTEEQSNYFKSLLWNAVPLTPAHKVLFSNEPEVKTNE